MTSKDDVAHNSSHTTAHIHTHMCCSCDCGCGRRSFFSIYKSAFHSICIICRWLGLAFALRHSDSYSQPCMCITACFPFTASISPTHTHIHPPHRIVSSHFLVVVVHTIASTPRRAAYRILPLHAGPSTSSLPPPTTTTKTQPYTHTSKHLITHHAALLLLPSPRHRHQLCLPHNRLPPRFPNGPRTGQGSKTRRTPRETRTSKPSPFLYFLAELRGVAAIWCRH